MIRARAIIASALCLCGLVLPAAASAADGPALKPALTALPSNLTPGQGALYLLQATNVGAAATSGQITLQVTIPGGLDITKADGHSGDPYSPEDPACTIAGQLVTCHTAEALHPGYSLEASVRVEVPADAQPGSVIADAGAGGGGAPTSTTTAPAEITSSHLPFDFLNPLTAPLTEADGTATTLAGSHPYQYTVDLGFPAAEFEALGSDPLISTSDPARDLITDLPPGLVANPAATPVRCTEAELTEQGEFGRGCPEASQVGVINLTTSLGGRETVTPLRSPLYNMVPPLGAPAELAFDVGGVGIFVHLIGGVRSDSDYGAYTESTDILALGIHPFIRVQAQVWGDPSGAAHDAVRWGLLAPCAQNTVPCPVPDQSAAFLTAPAACPGTPLLSEARADSWSEPGVFKSSSYQSADLEGNPVSISGCNSIAFKPTISAAPTTNLADSPAGLDLQLHLPTDLDKSHRSPAQLRDASVTLPPGMAANPSLADGLAGCTATQIGLITDLRQTPAHFDKTPNTCPDASRLGGVEVTTPLLAQYTDGDTKVVTDPETGRPLPEPLHGSLYLAKPFANPFGSLLALYLTVEDSKTGTIAKLAGQVMPDPQTGQLTTVFRENPQLPIEDIKLHVFGGARAPLITPPTCGAHTTTTDLTPWSAPETPDATPASSFQTSAAPGGGPCPASAGAAPNSPGFDAGTLAPQAGAYSPFVLKVSREDGSQRLTGIETTLPPGLTGKLAGVAECPEEAIARAASRSNPEEGILERNDPSCPASSRVGIVNVGAGAGPNPFYAQGHAYLAGPYKGAPLSLAIITPAIAGPFDLGTVVVRTALRVDPFSAQIHAVSDPLPQILDGIPLDIRSVALLMDRPDFTLNPTSCNPMTITGAAIPALGGPAPLSAPFQVGGCRSLGFKPKLTLKLKGGTRRSDFPSLHARVTYPSKGAYANIASAQVNLPHSEFLEQAHIGTVCTQPQLASHTCPEKSIYGHARAVTPLLDQPLEGPVYLGVGFGHELPDLVADLNGQIEVLLHGKTDTGKNDGLRNTFQVVPDAPVTSFDLTLFGGKRGLIVNSENLCRPKSKTQAFAHFTAQNGDVLNLKPKVQNECKRRHKGHHKGGRHHKGGS